MTYCSFVGIQFAIYEKILHYKKQELGPEKFKEQEIKLNCFAGLVAGCIAAALTNSFESVTVAKQTKPSTDIYKMIREDGTKLITRGIVPRIVYNGGQSFVFFNVLLLVGKAFNVDLTD